MGGYCCKSRKSNDVKNLAKVDFWPTWPLQYSVTPIRSSLVVLVQTMWSLISPRAKRISGPEKISIATQEGLLQQYPGAKQISRRKVATSVFDPTATSPLRHPGYAQALIHALAPSKEIRIVAEPGSTEAANGEAWIERQSDLCGSTRLIEQPELR